MTHSKQQISERTAKAGDLRATFRSRPHDVQNLYVSLKQWRILHAVIDCGGFAEAAKSLHLSQSTISYTLSKLQDQLGIPLLRIEGRKAMLTTEGRALLERSRHVLKEAIELETFAKNLGQGWGGQVRLVVDQNFPMRLLMRALSTLTERGRGAVHFKLSEVAMLQADEVLRDQTVDLAISERVPLGFLGEPLIELEYIPVAHPTSPLLQLGREVTAADLAQQTHIVIGQANDRERGTTGMKSAQRWTMSSFDTAVEAVSECLGYAWLPEHRVRPWLEQGALMRLPMADKRVCKAVLYLIHGRSWTSSPAAAKLAELLRHIAAESEGEQGARLVVAKDPISPSTDR
jgi:DNA-binding transcriptional LysR family regulator